MGTPQERAQSVSLPVRDSGRRRLIHVTYSYFTPEGKAIKHVRFERRLDQAVAGTVQVVDVPEYLFFDHVAIAVRQGELEQQVSAYKSLGFTEIHREDMLGSDQVREVLLRVGEGPNLVQLLEPLSPESPVAKQLERNGGRGGVAHVAFRVSDIHHAFHHMKANGFNVIDPGPAARVSRDNVFFVHPKTFGYLIEVVQEGAANA